MEQQILNEICRILPKRDTLHYFPDRESPWLLAQKINASAMIADVRKSNVAKLLNRPLVRDVLSASGDGRLMQSDLLASSATCLPQAKTLSIAADRGVQRAFSLEWRDYEISYDTWGVGTDDWRWCQMSRPGGNLVLQVSFPTGHAEALAQLNPSQTRKSFEYCDHPIRTKGRSTMSWARLDICLDSGVALIEEIQSDWFRNVSEQCARLRRQKPKSRELRNLEHYQAMLIKRYAKDWGKVTLFSALKVVREEFGCQTVFMHQPKTGVKLKSIRWGAHPPRSIYTKLPRAFCFQPTDMVPAFLERIQSKNLRALRRDKVPVFWKLDFEPLS